MSKKTKKVVAKNPEKTNLNKLKKSIKKLKSFEAELKAKEKKIDRKLKKLNAIKRSKKKDKKKALKESNKNSIKKEERLKEQEGVVANLVSDKLSVPDNAKPKVAIAIKSQVAPKVKKVIQKKGSQNPEKKAIPLSTECNTRNAITFLRNITTSNDVDAFVKNDNRITIKKAAAIKLKSLARN